MQKQKVSDSDSQLEQKKQISEKGKCVEDTIDVHKLVMDSGFHTKSLQNSSNTADYNSTSARSPDKEPLDNVNEESMKTICNANIENFVTVSKDASLSAMNVQVVSETSGISADGNLDAIFNECKGHTSPIRDVIKGSTYLNENRVKLPRSSEKEKSSFLFGTADKPTEFATAINNQSEKVCSALDSRSGGGRSSNPNNATSIHGNEVQLVNLLQNSVLSLDAVTKQRTGSLRKRKLLVLDINGLLADITPDIRHVHKGRKKVGGKVVFKRPFCDDFMKFCFEKFDVGIWSSRKKYNVDDVIDYILGENRQKLLFCWDQDHCTPTGFRTLDNVHKPLVLKELKRLWNKEENDLPWEKGDFSPSNTLLVDDSPYKALCNPAFTAIFPHPYHCDNANDTALGAGGDLRVYLEGLYEANDVQLYVKQHPFGQQGITSNDPSWDFYSQVTEEVHHGNLISQKQQGKKTNKSSASMAAVSAWGKPSSWALEAEEQESSRRGPREPREPLGPSRADGVDDWGKTKKAPAGFERRESGSSRGGGGCFGESRADESDSWVPNKGAAPPMGGDSGRRERRGYDLFDRDGSGADSESWGRRREDSANNSGGSGGRPRIVLQPRTLPIEMKSAEAAAVGGGSRGVNPFGGARPREEVLKEKGKDWKEIDQKLENVEIQEVGGSSGRRDFGRADKTERAWRKPVADEGMKPQIEGDDKPSF